MAQIAAVEMVMVNMVPLGRRGTCRVRRDHVQQRGAVVAADRERERGVSHVQHRTERPAWLRRRRRVGLHYRIT